MHQLFAALKTAPDGAVFNPWFDVDPDYDQSKKCPAIRRAQLRQCLAERWMHPARCLLIAEAIGYQGGHFTGMAMTSERLLLGELEAKGLCPGHVFLGLEPRRTSNPASPKLKNVIQAKGFNEPTATVVWGWIVDSGFDTRDFILWNAFAWHPFHANKGMLSNRTPNDDELQQGRHALITLLELSRKHCGDELRIVAIGKKSAELLSALDVSAPSVRHPANGGVPEFRRQMNELLR
ncbi:uracil-DNA glycosylase [Candidatus Sumerlaeota bacterium]|nr:uracil-DNA glycosylase [Candidatus Sumerlaeota bacterium]